VAHEVLLPQLGESVDEGVVVAWLVEVGDTVDEDQPLLELATDKVDTEIPAPVAGTVVELRADVDEAIAVGAVIAVIDDGSPSVDTPAPPTTTPATTSPTTSTKSDGTPAPASGATARQPAGAAGSPTARLRAGGDRPPASPLAKRLLADAGIDLADVTPTRSDGHVLAADARAAVANPPRSRGTRPPASPLAKRLLADAGIDLADVTPTRNDGHVLAADARAAVEDAARAPRPSIASGDDRSDTVALDERDLARAATAMQGLREAAQLTAVVEADLGRTMHLVVANTDAVRRAHDVTVSPATVVARALCLTLPRHPTLNARVDLRAGTATHRRGVDLGLEVDTDAGTVHAAVPGAGDYDLVGLARNVGRAADRAHTGQVAPQGEPASFTLVDDHSRGTLVATPLLRPGQVAVLSLGAVTKRPAVGTVGFTEAVTVQWTADLCLTYDHRLADGADAARFLQDLCWVLAHHDLTSELRLP
jgi:2-oxoglutarate dehydrogenase E2 component (dihydrolipoamide succinyltransferase)